MIRRRSVAVWVAALVAVALVIFGVGLFAGRAAVPRGIEPRDIFRPPADQAAVASGVVDNVTWTQYAWGAPGLWACTSVVTKEPGDTNGSGDGGVCTFGDSPVPFMAITGGDSAIVLGRDTPSRSTLVEGIVGPNVASVSVVGAKGESHRAKLADCPCGAQKITSRFFSAVVTQDEVVSGPRGSQWVTLIAYDAQGTEMGSVRYRVRNLDYCPAYGQPCSPPPSPGG